MSANFRAATAADDDVVERRRHELFLHETLPFDDASGRRALQELREHPEFGGVWLIEVDGEEAGYFVLTVGYSIEFRGRFGLLDEFLIDGRRRGQGIGARALAFMDEWCRERGIVAMRLEVGFDNPRALELYKRAGYEVLERHFLTKWLTR